MDQVLKFDERLNTKNEMKTAVIYNTLSQCKRSSILTLFLNKPRF